MTKEMILENVIIKPVNITRNGNYLDDKPYIRRFRDIAGVFCIPCEVAELPQENVAKQFAAGWETIAVITNETLRKFDLTIDELETAAKANAKYVLKNVEDVIPTGGKNLFKILTTENNLFGGAAIFDDSVFTNPAYILPSSIHELLIIYEVNQDASVFRSMVRSINEEHVCRGEVLSDNVFFFDGKEIKEC